MTQTSDYSRNPIFNTIIRYPQFNEITEAIDRCERRVLSLGESRLLVLEGKAGAGKTTIMKHYLDAYPRFDAQTGLQVPAFHVITPSPVTVGGMASKILEVFGDKAYDRGTISSKNSRIVQYTRMTGVRIFMIDEFQNLIDQKTDRVLRDVADWVKVLMKETAVPFLLAGIEGQVVKVLKANDQLSRMCLSREVIRPFRWVQKDEKTQREFNTLIEMIEQVMGYDLPDNLPRKELLHRIHYATDGVVGHVIELMQAAVERLELQNVDVVSMEVLSQAFGSGLRAHLGKVEDPFACPVNKRFIPNKA